MTQVEDVDSKEKLAEQLKTWKEQVLERDGNACINCEKSSHIAAVFVIPPDAGGRIKVSNGVTVCRECRIAAERARVMPPKIDNKTPINFLISRSLYDSVSKYATDTNLGSISAVVRNMMLQFITSPEQFEDLAQWQDPGDESDLVKVNGWCSGHHYELFKHMCWDRNITFTDAFKGLLLMAVATGTSIVS